MAIGNFASLTFGALDPLVIKMILGANDLEHKLLELDYFCPDAAASLPPSVRVKS